MGLIIRFGDPDAPLYEFQKKEIVSVTDNKNINLIGEELNIDTLTPLVQFTVIHPEPLIDSEGVPLVDSEGVPLVEYGTRDLRLLPHGTKATLYEVYGDEETLKAVYFVDDVERIAKDQYQINCMSIIGRLEEQHWIGRFFYNNLSIEEVIDLILGDSIDYQISVYLKNRRIYGYIANGTKREALYHLMLGYGVGIYNDRGTLIFRPVGEVGNAELIPDERIYQGGKVNYPKPPSSVQVTSHFWEYMHPGITYEDRVVFDNTQSLEPANNEVIEVDFVYTGFIVSYVAGEEHLHSDFDDDPSFDIVRNSLGRFTIQSGIGKLSLRCPQRIDTVVEVTNPDAQVERVVSVTDEQMISPYNAKNVANRLMEYYTNGKIIEQSIVLDKEICGRMYEFNNAFGEPENAAMTSMQTVYSGVTKANCRLVAGTNPAIDFPYTNYAKYEEDQVIDLTPLKAQGITEIGIMLIGGGQAGFDGQNGGDGENGDPPASGDFINRGGKGGLAGKGGGGGKTKLVTLDITDIDELTLTVGAGGLSNGAEGGITSISYTVNGEEITIDSSDGERFSTGTLNPLSGETYGERGDDGISGGDGGNSGRIFAAKILNPDWSYSGGAVDENGLPIDISETVEAQPGQMPKAGNSVLFFSPNMNGQASRGNYGTNLLMYYGSTDTFDIYVTVGGAGGGGAAYNNIADNGEAVYG